MAKAPADFVCDSHSPFDWQDLFPKDLPLFNHPPPQPDLPTNLETRPHCGLLLGNSPALHRVLEEVAMVAPTDAPVLITGETGVGKELIASRIHSSGPRRDHPMVRVNCTAIPHELFESEFFGHVRGAFSGASRDRIGRFQLADGGSLFLDEVGGLPLEMQPKLLRVLEDGEFEPVGDDKTRRVNVRVIAASNRNLAIAIRAGQFREDLYHRLSVFPIEVPPLRERKDDIAILAQAFIEATCRHLGRPSQILTENDCSRLRDYDWPGNIRELRNVVERAVIRAHFGILRFDLPDGRSPQIHDEAKPATAPSNGIEIIRAEEMKRRERENIIAALRRSKGRICGTGGAAELLGVRPTTLSARVRKLGLRPCP
jgi:transcriptional regulator with GAF, ATPase, and Fis domain